MPKADMPWRGVRPGSRAGVGGGLVLSNGPWIFLTEGTNDSRNSASKLLNIIVDSLDIPKSYYIKAVERHKSVGEEWLCAVLNRS